MESQTDKSSLVVIKSTWLQQMMLKTKTTLHKSTGITPLKVGNLHEESSQQRHSVW
jgi:hypothetical protein